MQLIYCKNMLCNIYLHKEHRKFHSVVKLQTYSGIYVV